MTRKFTLDELKAKHSAKESAYICIRGKVYDVTKFATEHPGGEEILLEHAGTDATADFDDIGHSESAIRDLQKLLVGEIAAAPQGTDANAPPSDKKG